MTDTTESLRADKLRRQHYYVSLAMQAYEPTADKLLYCDTHQRIVLTFDGRMPCCIAADEATFQKRLEAAEQNHVERKHIDATPDDDYPLRVLRAYRADCDMRWSLSTTNGGQDATPLMEQLNAMQEQRAAILDRAIAALAREEKHDD